MGMLISGIWHEDNQIQADRDGQWRRTTSLLRNWISQEGTPGSSGIGGFKAEAKRYHLYAAWNCPWAHRTQIFRKLKQLEDIISISFVAPQRTSQGWVFESDGQFKDHLFGATALHQIYTRSNPDYTGRVTVPVLWDKKTGIIVSNESADIIRMFNDAFVDIASETPDYVPTELRPQIDAWNSRIYTMVNNGVYKAGFATTQAAYEEAVIPLFETLDILDNQLNCNRYLMGDRQTEADWRLFPTLIRFDTAYYGAFKCNLRRLTDYPNLWPYVRELYQVPGIAETVNFEIYRRGYYSLNKLRNPLGIVPVLPDIDFSEPHDRS